MEHSASDHPHSDVPDQRLAVLQALRACDAASHGILFGFDVRRRIYVADLLFATLDLRGPLPLAIYHELKHRQFILEYDAVRRPNYRYFTLTERGRRMADGRSS